MKIIQNNPTTVFLLNLIISHQSELLRYSFLINPTLNELNCASTCRDFVYGQGTILSILIVISHSYFHIPVCSHSIPIILHHFLLVKCRENHDIMTGRTPLIVPFRRKSTKRSRKRRRHLGLWVEPTEMGKTTNLALSPKVILDASYSQMGYIYIYN